MFRVMVVDIGGNNVKMQLSDGEERRKFTSGPTLTPQNMVDQVKAVTADWSFDRVTLGYPGPVQNNRIAKEPANLGPGWLDFDFTAAFDQPVQLVNDAAMQAFGSYDGGKMLFLGLGTGLGATLVTNNVILPLEVAHMPYKGSMSFEDFVGKRGYERLGKKLWRNEVITVAEILRAAFVADYVLFGGGNAKRLKNLPDWCRIGANTNAFKGGADIWSNADLRIL